MRFKVFYAIICVLLLSSCAVSSFSNRSTSRSLYQHGHFKKPAGFKVSNLKNEHQEKFQAGNSSLIFSEELTLIQDSIVPKNASHELVIPIIKRQNSYNNEHRLINDLKSIFIPQRDSSSNAKIVNRTHTMGIIGGAFALAIPVFYVIGLSGVFGVATFPVFGAILIAVGFFLAIAALVINLITIRYLDRIDETKKFYNVIAIISLIIAAFAIFAALIGVLILFIMSLFTI